MLKLINNLMLIILLYFDYLGNYEEIYKTNLKIRKYVESNFFLNKSFEDFFITWILSSFLFLVNSMHVAKSSFPIIKGKHRKLRFW